MGNWSYGVVLDAGSSGTRVYVYKWAKPSSVASHQARLPVLETYKEWTKKTTPGISSFNTHPQDVGPTHLQPLFDHALKYIDEDEVKNTPVFLLATAGMRLLPAAERDAILNSICTYTVQTTNFLLPDCKVHIQVIPGNTEGLFGWMAANYLIGGFDRPNEHNHGKEHHTYGFLDMGGASSQIAFVPNATESKTHANDLTLLRLRTSDGASSEYRVFSTTWLGAGVNQARERYNALLFNSVGSETTEVPDPCLPKGLKLAAKNPHSEKLDERTLIGTGQVAECEKATFPLLGKDAPCLDQPCLINGTHTPAIDFDIHHFVGVSEYWYSTHGIFDGQHQDPQYNFEKYQSDVNTLCSRPWEDLLEGLAKDEWAGTDTNEQKLQEVCFKASWLLNVLHNGIGVPRVGSDGSKPTISPPESSGRPEFTGLFSDPFKAVNRINDMEVSWTLGKILLYASAQIPAAAVLSAPVGFGPNRPGVEASSDWTPGSASVFQLPLSGNNTAGWGNSTLTDYSPRQTPGMLLFIGILFILGYLLLGKTRRRSLYARLAGPFKSDPTSGTGISAHSHSHTGSKPSFLRRTFDSFTLFRVLPSRNKQNYTSVPDIDLEDPKMFELDPYDSENSAGSSSGGSVRRTRPAVLGSGGVGSSSSASIFTAAVPAPSSGLTPSRTESADLLNVSAMGNGGGRVRSRQGSPTRTRR